MTTQRDKKVAVSRFGVMTCSACAEIRAVFPQYNFCFDCVKSQPEQKLSALEKWLRHLDVCKFQRRGQCPNLCGDGQHLWSRAHNTVPAAN